jgi:hypothetical protein
LRSIIFKDRTVTERFHILYNALLESRLVMKYDRHD